MSTALKKEIPNRPEPRQLMDDDIVRLEVATETMAAYIGYLTTQIHKEEDQPAPNQWRIKALRAQKNVILDERQAMRPDNEELIAKAIYVYGPIMKALYA
jgi:hypothetical protein